MTAARCWGGRPLALWLPGPRAEVAAGTVDSCLRAGGGAGARGQPLVEHPGSHCHQGWASWASRGRHGLWGWLTDAEARCFIRFDILCPVERVTKMPGGVCPQLVPRSCVERSHVPALPLAHGMGRGVPSHPGGSAGAEGLGGDPKGRKPPLSFRGGELGLCWWQEARQDGILSREGCP